MKPTDKALLLIFTILLLQAFYSILSATTSDVDIAFRGYISMLTGYFVSSAFMAGKTEQNPIKGQILAIIAVVACIMLVVVRNVVQDIKPVLASVATLRDVFGGVLGVLVGVRNDK